MNVNPIKPIAQSNSKLGENFHPQLSTRETLIDSEQCFLLWCSSNFDTAATAHALNINPVQLQRCIDDEGWHARVAPIIEKIRSQKPGDFERSVNRSLAFCQGMRFRIICERVITEMSGWTKEELRENLLPESITKGGLSSKKISTRWLGDFAAALTHANNLCFAALNDTATERVKRNDTADVGPVLDLHAKISACMSNIAESKTPRNLLLSAQLEVAESIKQQAVTPKPIVDDTYQPDEH